MSTRYISALATGSISARMREELMILLAGGTKKKQSEDIARAQVLWADYKERKKEENNNAPNKRL